jgi:hypothetical protein
MQVTRDHNEGAAAEGRNRPLPPAFNSATYVRNRKIRRSPEVIMEKQIEAAARVLIGLVRQSEVENNTRVGAELTLEVELPGGGRETWQMTIQRTAST